MQAHVGVRGKKTLREKQKKFCLNKMAIYLGISSHITTEITLIPLFQHTIIRLHVATYKTIYLRSQLFDMVIEANK